MIEKPLLIKQKNNLRDGQRSLYELICKKIKENCNLTYEEAKQLYIKFGCQTVFDGVPKYQCCLWSKDEHGMMRYEWREQKGEILRLNVLNWLTRNIGLLVIRGYLQVLPALDLTTI